MNSILLTHAIVSIICLNWSVFTTDVGGFSVLSPGELHLEVKNIPTSTGELQWNNYSYQVQDSTQQVFLYSITHYDFPLTEIASDTTDTKEQIFTETIEAIVERLDGELLYTQTDMHGEFPARISRVGYKEDTYSLKSKIILAKDQIFMLEVFSAYAAGTDHEVNKFIDSFTFLD